MTSGADSCEKCRIRLISGKRLTSRSHGAQRDAWVEELAGAEGLKGDEGVRLARWGLSDARRPRRRARGAEAQDEEGDGR